MRHIQLVSILASSFLIACGGPGATAPPPETADEPADVEEPAGEAAETETAETEAAEATETAEATEAEAETEAAAPPTVPGACPVAGRATVENVSVVIPGQRRPARFTSVNGDLASVIPEGREATVRFAAPLAFEGTTRDALPYVLSRDLDVAFGLVHLSRQTAVTRVARRDEGGATIDVQLADGVSVRGLTVECGVLALGEVPVSPPPNTMPPDQAFLSRGGQLRLAAAPDDAERTITIRLARAQEVILTQTAEQEDWVRVWHSFASGAGIQGWARRSALREARSEPRIRERRERAEREPRERPGCEQEPDAGFFLGPASVRADLPVHSAPDGEQWATVGRDGGMFSVRTVENADWVKLERISGITVGGRCPENLENAWVPRSGVAFMPAGGISGGMSEGQVE